MPVEAPFPMLSNIVLLPLFGAIATYIISSGTRGKLAKEAALFFSLVVLALTAYLTWLFYLDLTSADPTSGYLFKEDYQWVPSAKFRIIFGVDGLSLPMVFLTALLTPLSIVFSWDNKSRNELFFPLLLILETGLMGVFLGLDFFMFYVFWEIVLIPMYFLINIWGGEINKKEAHYAAVKFFIYTHVASLVMLLSFMAIYFSAASDPHLAEVNPCPDDPAKGCGTFSFEHIQQLAPSWSLWMQSSIFLALFFGFGVKMPLVPAHTWLPDAHVQAPTAGSVMLAAVLLKMGGYGIIRVAVFMFPGAAHGPLFGNGPPGYFVLLFFAVLSMIYAAMLCLAQTDLKRLVAYSSVSHMGLALLGIAAYCATFSIGPVGTPSTWADGTPRLQIVPGTGSLAGLKGGYYQMFAHGLITSVLFMFCGSVLHKAGTRDITQLGGIAKQAPKLATVMAFGAMASLGLPGLASFPSEIAVFAGSWEAFGLLTVIPAAAIVLTAAYYIWMLQRTVFGPAKPKFDKVHDIEWFEAAPFAVLVVLIGIFGVFPDWVMSIVPGAGVGR
jgi:NADH-quinone oxidoreductase subunit M